MQHDEDDASLIIVNTNKVSFLLFESDTNRHNRLCLLKKIEDFRESFQSNELRFVLIVRD